MTSDDSSKLPAPEAPSSSEFTCSVLQGVDLPDDLRRHRLVAGRRFYAVPLELWKGFKGAVKITQLDQEIASVDRALSEFAESVDGCVGFADGVPIVDGLVRPPAPWMTSYPRCKAIWRSVGGRKSELMMWSPSRNGDSRCKESHSRAISAGR